MMIVINVTLPGVIASFGHNEGVRELRCLMAWLVRHFMFWSGVVICRLLLYKAYKAETLFG